MATVGVYSIMDTSITSPAHIVEKIEVDETIQSLNKPTIAKDGTEDPTWPKALKFIEDAFTANSIRVQYSNDENKALGNAALHTVHHSFAQTGMPSYHLFHLPLVKEFYTSYFSEKFVGVVHYKGKLYHGKRCKSKNEAKAAAAFAFVEASGLNDALDKYIQKQEEIGIPIKRRSRMDTESTVSIPSNSRTLQPDSKKNTVAEPVQFDPAECLRPQTQYYMSLTSKNASAFLNEFLMQKKARAAEFIVEDTEHPNGRYVAIAKTESFGECRGTPCRSKQLAKHSAARCLLNRIISAGHIPTPQPISILPVHLTSPTTFAEFCRHACFQALLEASKTQPLVTLVDSHISGCIMVNAATRSASLVSMACGSYAGPQIYNNGCDVRDCDALVLCKRGLQRFLLKQIRVFLIQESASIFYRHHEILKLRPGVSFHFYLNYNPCRAQTGPDQIRVKPAQGMNKFAPRQYVPHSMSTPDKVLKWNVVGIQGAVLSQFIDPVFIRSFFVNDADAELIKHQFYQRCPLQKNPVNKPMVEVLPKQEPYDIPLNPYNAGDRPGLVWNLAVNKFELISCSSGFGLSGSPVSISEVGQFGEISKIYQVSGLEPVYSYKDAKQPRFAQQYFNQLFEFKRSLESNKFGIWVIKTIKQY